MIKRFFILAAACGALSLLAYIHVIPWATLGLLPFAFGGVAMEMVGGQVTAPGATVTALTAFTGDTFAVRSGAPGKAIYLLQYWAGVSTAGIFEVTSPRMHDAQRALRNRVTIADVLPLGVMGSLQQVFSNDTLKLSLSGGAAGKIEQGLLLLYYTDLPASSVNFLDFPALQKRGVNDFDLEVAITPGATGNWSGAAAMNASFDTIKADSFYAVAGFQVDTAVRAVAIKGPDTGNYRVGGPGSATLRHLTARWFAELSTVTGFALIPVIKGANKAGTLVDVAQSDLGTAVNVTLKLIELSPA